MSFEIHRSDRRIVARASERLPFEPKGWKRDFRDQLATAARSLVPVGDEILRATYTSTDYSRCDVENIVIYNVGPSAFSSAAANGLLVERAYTHRHADLARPHTWAYELVSNAAPWAHWRPTQELAGWRHAVVPALNTSTKVATIWWHLHHTPVRTSNLTPSGAPIGLDLNISVPTPRRAAPAAIVKPLVDGVISAFHAHDGTDEDHITQRLATILRQPPDAVRARLRDTTRAVLGTRRLLWRFLDGVQWNPADDNCTAIRIATTATDGPDWELAGTLVNVEPFDEPTPAA